MPEPIDTPARIRRLVHIGEAGILDGLAGRVDPVHDERVDLALDLEVDALVRVEAIFMVGGFTSQAMRHFWSLASKWVIGPAPLLLARMFFQLVSTSPPSGVTRPSPVTTTRRMLSLQIQQAQTLCGLSLSKLHTLFNGLGREAVQPLFWSI